MTDPIISPWLIYLFDVANSIKIALVVLFCCILGYWAFIFIAKAEDYFDTEQSWFLSIKIGVVITVITILGAIFIPSRNTLLVMFFAKYITPQSFETAGGTIDEALNKLIDKIVDKQNK